MCRVYPHLEMPKALQGFGILRDTERRRGERGRPRRRDTSAAPYTVRRVFLGVGHSVAWRSEQLGVLAMSHGNARPTVAVAVITPPPHGSSLAPPSTAVNRDQPNKDRGKA